MGYMTLAGIYEGAVVVQRRARVDFERLGPSHHATTKAAFARATLLVVTAARGLYAELDKVGAALEREPVGHKRAEPSARPHRPILQRTATPRAMTSSQEEMLRLVLRSKIATRATTGGDPDGVN